MATLNLSISPELAEFVDAMVESGRFRTRDEVVIASLVLLEERQKAREAAKAKLQALIEEGEAAIERGDVVDIETLERNLQELQTARLRDAEGDLQRTA